MLKELANVFEGINGVLHGLRREAVHEVSMDQDARI